MLIAAVLHHKPFHAFTFMLIANEIYQSTIDPSKFVSVLIAAKLYAIVHHTDPININKLAGRRKIQGSCIIIIVSRVSARGCTHSLPRFHYSMCLYHHAAKIIHQLRKRNEKKEQGGRALILTAQESIRSILIIGVTIFYMSMLLKYMNIILELEN